MLPTLIGQLRSPRDWGGGIRSRPHAARTQRRVGMGLTLLSSYRSSNANAHPTCSHMPHIYTYACTHMGTLTGIAGGRPSANLWKNPPPMNHNPA